MRISLHVFHVKLEMKALFLCLILSMFDTYIFYVNYMHNSWSVLSMCKLISRINHFSVVF